MQAINRKFTAVINGNTQFLIPVFQRDYTWTEEQCDRLWRDIMHAGSGTEKGHFLGSIVYVATADNRASFTRWLVVDGQQRLTSLTLLMIALRNYIIDASWFGSPDSPTRERIDAYFLKNVHESGERRHKLVLRRTDDATLRALIDGNALPEDHSQPIVKGYELFRDRLKECADPDLVYRGATDLVIVDVTLDRTIDDPQLVFESLNSTGVDLSQSDLVRNYLLMGLEESSQTRLYEGYWRNVEELFRKSAGVTNSFVRDYVAVATQATKQIRDDRIYDEFKKAFPKPEIDELEKRLDDIARNARYYAAFMIGDNKNRLDEAMRNVRQLAQVPAILVTRLYGCHDEGSLSEGDFIQALSLIESYILRRAVCRLQTRGYWTVFNRLAQRLDQGSPLDSLKVGLFMLRTGNYRFPTDAEYKKALVEEDLYRLRICWNLLVRLENAETEEPSDTSKLSIEHIMPQNENLLPAWREMLGSDWKEVQEAWLHRLGNLTLTAYNSTYSDRPFEEKKSIPGGFDDSAVRLNKFVRNQSVWTKAEMEERGEILADRAIKIWPRLQVDEASVTEAEIDELRMRAKRRSPEEIDMDSGARAIFGAVRQEVLGLGNVIEITESKSVSYHHVTKFFLEILPRRGYLALVMPLDFSEVDDPEGLVSDATTWKFIPNSNYDVGIIMDLWSRDRIEKAMPIIRQAFTVAD